jgi:RNA-directed DNA polymerase
MTTRPRRAFSEISTLPQLAVLLHVSPDEMNYLLSHLKKEYRRRTKRKPDGTKRTLYIPSDNLKLLQKKINEHILAKVPLLPCVQGGVPRKSIIQNAAFHRGQPVVFTMDLEHCFPSIGPERVRAVFEALGIRGEAVSILTKLTTWDGELPQGVPTSTALANIALVRVDGRITGLQEHHDFEYTRWVDDLVFSGSPRILKLRRLFQRIIETEGFRVKAKKTKTMFAHQSQVVTNLVVNKKVNLSRENRAAIKKEVMQAVSQHHSFSAAVAGKVYWYRSVNDRAGGRLLKRAKEKMETHP